MSRRMVMIAFGMGLITAPLAYSLVGMCVLPLGAQEDLKGLPSKDLVVIEPPSDAKEVYLELINQKIGLLTPEELARETETLRKELVELQASRILREAESKLQRLIDEYQGSGAAQRARTMLESVRSRQRGSTNGDPFEESQPSNETRQRQRNSGVDETSRSPSTYDPNPPRSRTRSTVEN